MQVKIDSDRYMHYFEEISKIPRCSGNEREISDYLKKFAEDRNLYINQDENFNIVIRKKATEGYEKAPGVILQGHMDMVCEKSVDSDHDFDKDPIKLQIKDGYLKAVGTTLGADDGIAIAMGLAILESDEMQHPELELLVTVSEETDMSGALNLSNNILRGKKLINIDSEEEGILTVGSAGGVTVKIYKDIEREKCNWKGYCLEFKGLLGGHSGMEINKKRGNMLKIIAYFLREARSEFKFKLSSFISGKLDNAIPNFGEIKIQADIKDQSVIQNAIQKTKEEYSDIEGELEINISQIDLKESYTDDLTDKIIDLISEMPTGVNTFVKGSDSVESSNNLALIKEIDEKIYFENSIRSSNLQVQENLVSKCAEIIERFGFSYELDSEYPGWEYNQESSLRDLAQDIYRKIYDKDFETVVVHAGLECGAIASKYPEMDMISIGPNISGAHTVEESMELKSAERVYEFIVKLISEIKYS
ncbi:MAG: aminoacyl-histidine dipeptidase [Tissierellia bacterium]|nr:aminoacyl-histidine dipeptidase [Tissierellia bacterium]